MEGKKSLLDQFKNEDNAPVEKDKSALPRLVEKKADYDAFKEAKRGKYFRIRIIDANGISYGFSYNHLLDWMLTPPDILSLTTATRTFIIEGKGVKKIENGLMEERIFELRVFNPDKHKMPDKGKPIIEKLTIDEPV